MRKDKIVREGVIEVVHTLSRFGIAKSIKFKSGTIKIRPFITDTGSVSVKRGTTIPIGQFSSDRVDVSVTLPCYVEEVKDVARVVRVYVNSILYEEKRAIIKSIKVKVGEK